MMETRIYLFANIPDSLLNNLSQCKFSFAFNEELSNLSSCGWAYEDCDYQYYLVLDANDVIAALK